jgi:uncharacterized protein YxjI
VKTNLDSIYKTDDSLETEGVWLMITENSGFRVKRFGGKNQLKIAEKLARLQKPYLRQIQNGTMDKSIEQKINVTIFVEECIVDWQGIEIDGEQVPYDKQKCLDLLLSMPDLTDSLVQYAMDIANYREHLGN